jgi:type II secretory pathway predicted ATPase ExeA
VNVHPVADNYCNGVHVMLEGISEKEHVFPLQPYWAHYHLKQAPFEDSSQFAMYYPFARFQQYLSQLRVFCTNLSPLLVIEGELGIGKSMLLAQFAAYADGDIQVYEIKGRSSITAAHLIAHIAQGFQLDVVLNQASLYEQMQAEIYVISQMQKTCVLIIDDADLLPPEALATITQLTLLLTSSKQVNFYLLLSSEIKLHHHLENLAKEKNTILTIPTLTMTNLNADETKIYIKHRLAKAGLNGKMPFSKNMLQTIYNLSGGVPGRINRVAQRMLQELARPEPKNVPKRRQKIFSLSREHWIIGGLFFLFIAVIFCWNLLHQPHKVASPINTIPIQTPKPVMIQPQVIQKAPIMTEVSHPNIIVNNNDINKTAMQDIVQKPILAKVEPKLNKHPITYSTSEKHLLTLQGYTLQLFGSRNLDDLKKIIVAGNLHKGTLQFTAKFHDKPWHVLVYGHYQTPAEAKLALEKLPKYVKDLHPWVRPLTSVHQAIQQR